MEIKYRLVTHADRIAQISNNCIQNQESVSDNNLEIIVGISLVGIITCILIYDFYEMNSKESRLGNWVSTWLFNDFTINISASEFISILIQTLSFCNRYAKKIWLLCIAAVLKI